MDTMTAVILKNRVQEAEVSLCTPITMLVRNSFFHEHNEVSDTSKMLDTTKECKVVRAISVPLTQVRSSSVSSVPQAVSLPAPCGQRVESQLGPS